jgi:chemotaxis methyl-accepting protein methylase
MNQIYRNSYEGTSLYSKIIHKYATDETSSRSVRHRKEYLINKFKEIGLEKKSHISICSVACGPGKEIIDFVKTCSVEDLSRFNFVLMDQDLEALMNVKRNLQRVMLSRGVEINFSLLQISVRDFLEESLALRPLEKKQFEMVYSAGLYDYLSQPLAKTLTNELIKLVRKDGQLVIGNFHPANPTKAISEFLADWSLIHRDEKAMIDLVPELHQSDVSLNKDEEGIELFLNIKKTL